MATSVLYPRPQTMEVFGCLLNLMLAVLDCFMRFGGMRFRCLNSSCLFLYFGIKEIDENKLIFGKTYLFFSHTIKKQPYNRKMLKNIEKQ